VLKRGAIVWVVLAAACAKERASSESGTKVRPAPAQPTKVSPNNNASTVVARTLCDWYWRSSGSTARPYDTFERCIEAETKPRVCTEPQAQACEAFVRTLQPGSAGQGLYGSPDCSACLTPTHDPKREAEIAELRAAYARAKLVVHSADVHTDDWPTDLAALRAPTKLLVTLDVEMSNFGYRIDPDDFELLFATPPNEPLAGLEYAERLTRDGKPIDWRDPAVVNDPDLRMKGFFVVPSDARGKSVVVSFEEKRSAPFTIL
jgi:hypothetical protein